MILVALGANLPSHLGAPAETLTAALQAFPAHKIRVLKISSFYQTPAWPDPSDPPFVNAVAAVETVLDPAACLAALHAIEAQFGRERSRPNAPRTLDLDLLDYGGHILSGPPVLPHPRLCTRAFVLVPLAEIAPDWLHPLKHLTATALRDGLPAAERQAVVAQAP